MQGICSEGGNGNLLQYSCLATHGRGAWPQSMGSQRVGHDKQLRTHTCLHTNYASSVMETYFCIRKTRASA